MIDYFNYLEAVESRMKSEIDNLELSWIEEPVSTSYIAMMRQAIEMLHPYEMKLENDVAYLDRLEKICDEILGADDPHYRKYVKVR